MTHAEYIVKKKAEWIGRKVKYDGLEYTVVDVDSNGMLIIDRPARFTSTTAVESWMIENRD